MKKIYLGFTALVLAACSDTAMSDAVIEATGAADDSVPIIGEMRLPGTDAYCVFFREGHAFDFNDEASWAFILITPLGEDDIAMMNLDGQNTAMKRYAMDAHDDDWTEVWYYSPAKDETVQIALRLSAGEAGMEHQNYTGEVQVVSPGEGPVTKVWGDCGV